MALGFPKSSRFRPNRESGTHSPFPGLEHRDCSGLLPMFCFQEGALSGLSGVFTCIGPSGTMLSLSVPVPFGSKRILLQSCVEVS